MSKEKTILNLFITDAAAAVVASAAAAAAGLPA